MPCFWLTRQAAFLLGDQRLLLTELSRNTVALRNAPLTVLLNAAVYRSLNHMFGATAAGAYRVSGLVSGLVFILILFRLVSLMGFRNLDAASGSVLVLAAGPSVFFSGYAENYTYLYVAVLAYAWLSLRVLERAGSLLPSFVVFLLAASFHYTGLMLLPSLLYLIVSRAPRGRHPQPRQLAAGIAATLLALLGVYLFLNAKLEAGPFVPLLENREHPGYTMLSSPHSRDVLNTLLLVSPGGLLLAAACLRGCPAPPETSRTRSGFFLTLLIFPLLFLVTVEPDLGFARDWDLFSLSGLALAIASLNRFSLSRPRISPTTPVLPVLAATAFTLFIPWLLLNSSEVRSVERFSAILSSDGHSAAYGYEILAQHYRSTGDAARSVEALKSASRLAPHNPRYHKLLGNAYEQAGLPGSSYVCYRRAISEDSTYYPAYVDLGNLYYVRRDMANARRYYLEAIEKEPGVSALWTNVGATYYNEWDLSLAGRLYEEALRRDPREASAYHNLAQLSLSRGDSLLAERYRKKALALRFTPPR